MNMATTSSGSPILTLEPCSPRPVERGPIAMMRDLNPLNYHISPASTSRAASIPTWAPPVPFTNKPPPNTYRPRALKTKETQTLEEDFIVVSDELDQEDFTVQGETFFQRIRRTLLYSNTTSNQSPYIAIPIITLSLVTFGYE